MNIIGFIAIALAICLAGCTSKPGASSAALAEKANLSTIGRAYHTATEKLGHPPANVEQLRPFLHELGDPAEILRSPRDGEPYVIIYGFDIRKPFDMPPPIWAHERRGAHGKRYVITVMGVNLMTDDEFATANLAKH
jgi:hypothetical protein